MNVYREAWGLCYVYFCYYNINKAESIFYERVYQTAG